MYINYKMARAIYTPAHLWDSLSPSLILTHVAVTLKDPMAPGGTVGRGKVLCGTFKSLMQFSKASCHWEQPFPQKVQVLTLFNGFINILMTRQGQMWSAVLARENDCILQVWQSHKRSVRQCGSCTSQVTLQQLTQSHREQQHHWTVPNGKCQRSVRKMTQSYTGKKKFKIKQNTIKLQEVSPTGCRHW